MKKLALVNLLLATAIGLSACGKYNDDIQQYAQNALRQATSRIEELPKVNTFVAMKFEPKTDRMPFVLPKPEISMVQPLKPLDC